MYRNGPDDGERVGRELIAVVALDDVQLGEVHAFVVRLNVPAMGKPKSVPGADAE